jgi:hypothetical protein
MYKLLCIYIYITMYIYIYYYVYIYIDICMCWSPCFFFLSLFFRHVYIYISFYKTHVLYKHIYLICPVPIHPLPLWHRRYRSVDSNSRSRTSPSGAWEQNYNIDKSLLLRWLFCEAGLMWVNHCRKPSPNHYHFYRWYFMDLYHSQSRIVYGIVLPTLSHH